MTQAASSAAVRIITATPDWSAFTGVRIKNGITNHEK
jgi:hypothetical protein